MMSEEEKRSEKEKLFSEQAHLYARYRPRYPESMYQSVFQHLEGRHQAWDCGTGSGQIAGYLADHFKTVQASDISSEQMKYAVRKKNITYVECPAEKTPFPDSSFDLITVAQAIHWFDFDRFYREVQRTARNRALLAVIGYGQLRMKDSSLDPAVNASIKQLYDSTFSRYFSERRKYVNEEYRNIPFPFREIPAPRFTIRYQWNPDQIRGFFNSWSSIQKIRSQEGFNPAEGTMKVIQKHLPAGKSAEVHFPLFLRLGKVDR